MIIRNEEFKQALRALLVKYGVDISLEHTGGGEYAIEFYASPKWDEEGDMVHGGVDFQCQYFNRELDY